MEPVGAPQCFIDFSFYSLISIALQRRVWLGSRDHRPLFPNMYICSVAEPGVGKGNTTGPVMKILQSLKRKVVDAKGQVIKDAQALVDAKTNPPLMYPVGANVSSFEKAVARLSSEPCTTRYTPINPKDTGIYYHHSIAYVLDELTSVFGKESGEMRTLLISCYGDEFYARDTHLHGEERIDNPCVSILAGTQPDVLAECVRTRILNDGMLSRLIFVYGEKYRFRTAVFDAPSEQQLECYEQLRAYVAGLLPLYGQLPTEPGYKEWLNDWFKDESTVTTNKSPKLKEYFARKNIHVQKLAMALHFSEPRDGLGVLTIDTVKRAIAILEGIEPTMHRAFGGGGENKVASQIKPLMSILRLAAPEPVTLEDLLDNLLNELRRDQLEQLLADLIVTRKIVQVNAGTTVGYKLYA